MISSFWLRRFGIDNLFGFFGVIAICTIFFPRPAFAVVGQAEGFDEFQQRDLEEFHQDLLDEERRTKLEKADRFNKLIRLKKKELKKVDDEEKKAVNREIMKLEKELLGLPERDRFRFGADGDYKYDTNIARNPSRQEKGDSIFDEVAYTEIDFSGRKTDLSLELRYGRQWNIRFPDKDNGTMEERIRYRRKYFKKISQSSQSRISRHNEQTIEINENKIRWDSNQQTAFNYLMSPKFSANADFSATKRLFLQEAFDQDSSWEVKMAPAAFLSLTPKSRIQAGYTFGANRIRTKKGDTNSHEVHWGYFGQITRKSSASLDFAWSHQTPRERLTARSDTFTVGNGYVYQLTPKTQVTLQLSRSIQNTTSNVLPTADTAAAGPGAGDQVIKLDTHFTGENLSLSLNSRLTRKLSAVLSISSSHNRTKAEQQRPAEDLKTRQWTFPLSFNINYIMARWIRLRLAYSFTYRMGNERNDMMRSHTYSAGLTITF